MNIEPTAPSVKNPPEMFVGDVWLFGAVVHVHHVQGIFLGSAKLLCDLFASIVGKSDLLWSIVVLELLYEGL